MVQKKPVKKPASKSSAPQTKSSAPQKSNASGVTPLGDRILIKPFTVEETHKTTSFGIIIPDTAKEKPEQGTVVAVGRGKRLDSGTVPPEVKVGDTVMFSKYGFDEVKVNGIEYYIVSEASILAILH